MLKYSISSSKLRIREEHRSFDVVNDMATLVAIKRVDDWEYRYIPGMVVEGRN